jgi:hypothetical protein
MTGRSKHAPRYVYRWFPPIDLVTFLDDLQRLGFSPLNIYGTPGTSAKTLHDLRSLGLPFAALGRNRQHEPKRAALARLRLTCTVPFDINFVVQH